MRHVSGHYRNSSFIVDVAMGQIPRSTELISSYKILLLSGSIYIVPVPFLAVEITVFISVSVFSFLNKSASISLR